LGELYTGMVGMSGGVGTHGPSFMDVCIGKEKERQEMKKKGERKRERD
jgi:hypothetical protein